MKFLGNIFKASLPLLTALALQAEEAKSLSKSEIKSVVQKAADHLKRSYVFEKEGKELHDALLRKSASGDFDSLSSPYELTSTLTETLRSIVNDGHLYTVYSPPSKVVTKKPSEEEKVSPELRRKRWLEKKNQENWGFKEIKILREGLGYARIDYFDGNEQAYKKAVAMMQFFEDCNGIVIDLRNNGGGDGRMGLFLSSYFLPHGGNRWLLSHINRSQGKNNQEWSLPYVPGKKQPNIPLYILTSKGSFSAAEAFIYSMKSVGRAKLVGETTGGGAHAGTYRDLGHDVKLFLPAGQIWSPITKDNWEAKGIKPHIESKREEALNLAVQDYLATLLKTTNDETYKSKIRWQQDYFKAIQKKAETLDSGSLNNCAGEYENNRKVLLVDGQLVYKSPGGTLFPLYHLEGDVFFAKGKNVNQPEGGLRFVFPKFRTAATKAFTLQYIDAGIEAVKEYTNKRVK